MLPFGWWCRMYILSYWNIITHLQLTLMRNAMTESSLNCRICCCACTSTWWSCTTEHKKTLLLSLVVWIILASHMHSHIAKILVCDMRLLPKTAECTEPFATGQGRDLCNDSLRSVQVTQFTITRMVVELITAPWINKFFLKNQQHQLSPAFLLHYTAFRMSFIDSSAVTVPHMVYLSNGGQKQFLLLFFSVVMDGKVKSWRIRLILWIKE